MSEPMDYASAGVDIDLEGSAVASLIGALSKSVRAPGTPGAPVDLPGGFGGLIEFGDNCSPLPPTAWEANFRSPQPSNNGVALASIAWP